MPFKSNNTRLYGIDLETLKCEFACWQVLTNAVRGVAATTTDRQIQETVIDSARDVIEKSQRLLEEARQAMQNPNDPK
jgi:hypothetical protein